LASESGSPAPRPQLRMRRPDLAGLPPVEMPEGYALRTYRPGDEAAWAAIMNTGIGSGQTAELCRQKLTGLPQFDPEGLFFATHDGTPIGSACAWVLRPGEREAGELHMVCVLPEHRGHGLGYWLSLAVLHRFAERGFQHAGLNTDDFRLAAVKTYLELGFQPEHTHPGDAERWLLALARLRESDPAAPRPPTAPVAVAPIALVRNSVKAIKHHGWEENVSELAVEPAFAEALDGVEEFSHLLVLFWLHQVTPEQRSIPKLHPRDRTDVPLMGTLATHTQYRPNPIGLTVVRLLERRGSVLVVQGLDAIDGTPVLDVKPWNGREVPKDEVPTSPRLRVMPNRYDRGMRSSQMLPVVMSIVHRVSPAPLRPPARTIENAWRGWAKATRRRQGAP
jgi:tRNA-Thr(GGU) m(6)t(6)A37 methyltransferase TsaA